MKSRDIIKSMKFISIFIFQAFSNAIAILAAANFIAGFRFEGGFIALLTAGLILAAANIVLKPVLKLFLGPFIVLTLGLFLIVINAVIIYLLDIFTQPLIIDGYLPLLLGALLIGFINFLIQFSAKRLYRES